MTTRAYFETHVSDFPPMWSHAATRTEQDGRQA